MKISFRKVHRWLAITIALQIILWMSSGLLFSILPIEQIRGEHLLKPIPHIAATIEQARLPPSQAINKLKQTLGNDLQPQSLELVNIDLSPWYKINFYLNGQSGRRLVNATNNQIQAFLSTNDITQIASNRLAPDAPITAIELIETHQNGSEYRGRSLPLYRIDFDHPSNVRLYVDAWTGEVAATRTRYWRLFDFFWMLHIMDYSERDDFSHWLIRTVAGLALIAAFSGVVLWITSHRRLRQRKKQLHSIQKNHSTL